MSHQSLINVKFDPIPTHPPTFPARPIRGGKLELTPKKSGIPEVAAEEIISKLQAMFARHNAGAALSAKAVFKPTKEFQTARHRKILNWEC